MPRNNKTKTDKCNKHDQRTIHTNKDCMENARATRQKFLQKFNKTQHELYF